jgi:flagellum-specific peptidoglycan hydrolase FlgJ
VIPTQPVRKPRWQQATALMSLSTCGAMTGFAFAHGTVADLTSPTSMPVHLLALTKPAQAEPTNDSALRSAIVKAATYYLRLARDKSPAEMQALIWQNDSIGGADHGETCAAFASLVVQMGAQATGQDSWVSGGGTYPWPLHGWADVRVNPNPNSPNVVSIQQDAQTHGRWHALGDGYRPQPGDWVLFDGHVEVVTKYTGGVLYTIGGDSAPNLSVNAHQYSDPLAEQGVLGFVNNGELVTTASATGPVTGQEQADLGQSAIPGLMAAVLSSGGGAQQVAPSAQQQSGGIRAPQAAALGSAAIPGLEELTGVVGAGPHAQQGSTYGRSQPSSTHVPDTATQRAFISQVAPGAVAAQRRYGIPAAVTIAQAIDESGWGQSQLATADHNLFGIKGTGPAGTSVRPTEEYLNGSWVATTASFRVYNSWAESIADHSKLLATGESYQQAMTNRQSPDAFANDLTGVYATDPNYGSSLISIMRLYNLYKYDPTPAAAQTTVTVTPPVTTQVTAADHGANVPGLEPVDLAFGGSGAQAATTSGGFAADGSGRSGGRPSTPARSRTAHGGLTGGAHVSGSTRSEQSRDARAGGQGLGGARIPGLSDDYPGTSGASHSIGADAVRAARIPGGGSAPRRTNAARSARPSAGAQRYAAQIPSVVTTDFVTMAKHPLARSKPLYQDVARGSRIRWELLAACDWMQCKAQPQFSPVRGERLGTKNPDGTRFLSKSEALEQCAADLIVLADAVYQIDLTAPVFLSVLELAQVFAAFRWGGLLKAHRISAMEFPYSVEGLTVQHLDLRWPAITEANAPDKPGARFKMPFGAVPVVLSLNYPAVA